MKQKFNVTGMTCISCVSHVEKGVKKLKGIKEVNVNLLSSSMTVEYEESILSKEQIIKAVEDTGYKASLAFKEHVKKEGKENKDEEEIKSMKKRLIVSIFFLIPILYLAMYNMVEMYIGIPAPKWITQAFSGEKNALIFVFTQFLLLIPIVLANKKYFTVGYKTLWKRKPNMDSLVALGSSAAILYGIYAIYKIGYGLGYGNIEVVKHFMHDIYFESAATILTLITLGKYLETKSKGKTGEAITKLMDLTPKTVLVLRNKMETEIPLEEVKVGDKIVIKPGASIPVDGILLEGVSLVDESSITGESIPVRKEVGDQVIAGTMNKTGYFLFKAEKIGEDTTLARIIQLVEEAGSSKAPIAKLADKISGIFVPIVIGIALASILIWILLGYDIEFALSTGIAVLVISCPCALGLATPVAIMVGTGKGAENGILIKSAESLETLHEVDTVVFDKTGTITEGNPTVTDIVLLEDIEEIHFLRIAYSLEEKSEHPLAEAIIKKAEEKNCAKEQVKNFEAVTGKGVKGVIKGETYLGGNFTFMKENGVDIKKIKNSSSFARDGKTPLFFAKGRNIIGIIAVKDQIKESSREMVQALKNMHLDLIMLTGDNKDTAEAILKDVGMDLAIADVLPDEKEEVIARLQREGKKVAMVGDGINDSPALVRANVGIAIGTGTDIAIESADIVLIKEDLRDVVTAISLSKKVMKNIKMNLFWAFFYNSIGIPLAAGLFYIPFGLKLSPMFGSLAMSLSSLCVVTNALRIKQFQAGHKRK